ALLEPRGPELRGEPRRILGQHDESRATVDRGGDEAADRREIGGAVRTRRILRDGDELWHPDSLRSAACADLPTMIPAAGRNARIGSVRYTDPVVLPDAR